VVPSLLKVTLIQRLWLDVKTGQLVCLTCTVRNVLESLGMCRELIFFPVFFFRFHYSLKFQWVGLGHS
jgi:hypothetical protein